MADTEVAVADHEDEVDLEEFETKKGGPMSLALMVVVGLGIGGGVGFTQLGDTVGPILVERELAAEDDHGDAGDGGHGPEDAGSGGEGEEGEPASLHMIDNLVVNPARSQGTRFLLASIAVQMSDPGAVEMIDARDVELRDALILVLASKTVDQLTDISGREALVLEIQAAIVRVVGPDLVKNVFIPQFVIQ